MSSSGYEQTTAAKRSGRCVSAAPTKRPPFRLRVAVADEPFGRRDEIVEDVLLLRQHPGLVPFLAELASASQVGQGIDAAASTQRAARAEKAGVCESVNPP